MTVPTLTVVMDMVIVVLVVFVLVVVLVITENGSVGGNPVTHGGTVASRPQVVDRPEGWPAVG